jgi:hypothetical protein
VCKRTTPTASTIFSLIPYFFDWWIGVFSGVFEKIGLFADGFFVVFLWSDDCRHAHTVAGAVGDSFRDNAWRWGEAAIASGSEGRKRVVDEEGLADSFLPPVKVLGRDEPFSRGWTTVGFLHHRSLRSQPYN